MNVRRQSSLCATTMTSGIELHGGNYTRLIMRPAPIGTGLVFVRTDVTDRNNRIPVSLDAVTGARNCTTLSNKVGTEVSTVEHLLAALAAVGIDNLVMEIDGRELPALDGSAAPFLKLIEQVGVCRQPTARNYVKVLKPVEVNNGKGFARIEPCERLELDVSIDFSDEAIGKQRVEIVPDVRAFRENLASARTFARLHEVAALKAAGLSKGGSYDNAVVVDGADVLNPEGLRFDNEFVAHKATDLMGDLYIVGPVLGRVTTDKSGHGLNHDLLAALFSDTANWKYTTLSLDDLDDVVENNLLTSLTA
ncbi:MAG: UDP-3-O-acyl-N-acetylglucosamine deacetylase [Litorimonas sp.]